MKTDSAIRGRLCLTGAFLLLLAIIALWFPLSWRIWTAESGTRVTQVGVGVFEPLEFTWESSAGGFRFSVTKVRVLALVATALFTIAAQYFVQRAYSVWRRPGEPFFFFHLE